MAKDIILLMGFVTNDNVAMECQSNLAQIVYPKIQIVLSFT